MTIIHDIADGPIGPEEPEIFRVMIVDDSAFIRGAVARAIESDPNLRIVVSVGNGEQAVNALRRDPVDVIVLDIEMPVMDGLAALPLLKTIDPAVQIIMASTLTQKNAEISLRAMSLGATDYIAKPSTGHEVNAAEEFRHELVEKVRALGALARRTGVRISKRPLPPIIQLGKEKPKATPHQVVEQKQPATAAVPADRARPPLSFGPGSKRDIVLRKDAINRPQILAIGSSTGGPQALFKVIKDIGNGLRMPIVITQHMPPAFTTILAEHITKQCGVTCTEAKNGETLVPGHYYIAPGDYHMLFEGSPTSVVVKLTKDPPENFCRPAVDPMLRSLSAIFGRNLLVTILTGMGTDGTLGSEIVVKAGGTVIAQDETTSVVWGMPGAVAVSGLCTAVLPINEIGGFLRKTAQGGP